MGKIGYNIEKLETLIKTPIDPPPNWINKWQTEAEHLLFLAHRAKDGGDLKKLTEIDKEAQKMLTDRKSRG